MIYIDDMLAKALIATNFIRDLYGTICYIEEIPYEAKSI